MDFWEWAGVPDLAAASNMPAEVTQAWRASMPHLYCDRRQENEEVQKLVHAAVIRVFREIILLEYSGSPMTWDLLQQIALSKQEDQLCRIQYIIAEAKDRVAALRTGLVEERAYGTQVSLRRRFAVTPSAGQKKKPKVEVHDSAEAVVAQPGSTGPLGGSGPGEAPVQPGGEASLQEVWYVTTRTVKVHLQAAGDEWRPVCLQRRKQYKAADPATVTVLGSFEQASEAGRPVCEDCMVRR